MRLKRLRSVVLGALCAGMLLPVDALAGDACSRPVQPVPYTGANTPVSNFYGNTSYVFQYQRSWLYSWMWRSPALQQWRARQRSRAMGNNTESVTGQHNGENVTINVRPITADDRVRQQWERAISQVPECLRAQVMAGGDGETAAVGTGAQPGDDSLGVEAVQGQPPTNGSEGEVTDLAYKPPDANNPHGMIIAGDEIFDTEDGSLLGEQRYARHIARSHCGTDYDLRPGSRGKGNDSGLVNSTNYAIRSRAKLKWAISHEMIHAATHQNGRTSINTVGHDGESRAFGWYAWTNGDPPVSRFQQLKTELDERYGNQLNGDGSTNATPIGDRDLLDDSQWGDVGMNERISLLNQDFTKRWDEIYTLARRGETGNLRQLGAEALEVRRKMCDLVKQRTTMVNSVFGNRGRWKNDAQFASNEDEYFTVGLETALRLKARYKNRTWRGEPVWRYYMKRKGWTDAEMDHFEGWWEHNYGAPLGECGSGTQTAQAGGG